MKKNFVFMILLVTLYSLVEGLDEEQKKDCLRLSKRFMKKMMKSFNTCNAKLKYHEVSGELYQKKIGCVVKCVMQTVNVLDENDKITAETLKKTIESHVPPEYVDMTHEKLMTCPNKQVLDPNDEDCKSYLDMGTCMQGAVVEMCGEAPLL